jgi:hypothetical protein
VELHLEVKPLWAERRATRFTPTSAIAATTFGQISSAGS